MKLFCKQWSLLWRVQIKGCTFHYLRIIAVAMSSAAMNVLLGFIVIAVNCFANSIVLSCELHVKPLVTCQWTLDGVALLQTWQNFYIYIYNYIYQKVEFDARLKDENWSFSRNVSKHLCFCFLKRASDSTFWHFLWSIGTFSSSTVYIYICHIGNELFLQQVTCFQNPFKRNNDVNGPTDRSLELIRMNLWAVWGIKLERGECGRVVQII